MFQGEPVSLGGSVSSQEDQRSRIGRLRAEREVEQDEWVGIERLGEDGDVRRQLKGNENCLDDEKSPAPHESGDPVGNTGSNGGGFKGRFVHWMPVADRGSLHRLALRSGCTATVGAPPIDPLIRSGRRRSSRRSAAGRT